MVDLFEVPVGAEIHTKFSRVKKMSLHLDHYIPSNLMECRDLKSIEICGLNLAFSMVSIQELMDTQSSFFSTITELGLTAFSIRRSTALFVEILEKCSSIERLHLDLIHFDRSRLSAGQLNHCCPNLNHLTLIGNVPRVDRK